MKLTDKFKINDAERDQRMAFLGLANDDFRVLAELRPRVEKHIHGIVEVFYQSLLRHSEPRRYFADAATLERVKAGQCAYLLALFEGEPDEAWFERRLMIGEVHERIGVPLKWYVGSMGAFFGYLVDVLTRESALGPEKVLKAALTLNKIMNLDLQLALESYASLSLRMRLLDQRVKETAAALTEALESGNERNI